MKSELVVGIDPSAEYCDGLLGKVFTIFFFNFEVQCLIEFMKTMFSASPSRGSDHCRAKCAASKFCCVWQIVGEDCRTGDGAVLNCAKSDSEIIAGAILRPLVYCQKVNNNIFKTKTAVLAITNGRANNCHSPNVKQREAALELARFVD